MKSTALIVSIIMFPFLVTAEDFPGGDDEFAKGFAEGKGVTELDKKSSEEDKFRWGGSLGIELQHYGDDGTNNTSLMRNPSTLRLYIDSRLRNDIRGFVRGRLIYDPTVDETKPNPITNTFSQQYNSTLEEMKLSFNLKKRLFLTMGKQKIKWGAAKFWNPTDFVNTVRRDFFQTKDDREGVSLLKTHLPIGSSNFYAIAITNQAQAAHESGWALRYEYPIKQAEFSLSAAGRKERKNLYGADFSAGIGDFDLYGEYAYSNGSDTLFYEGIPPFSSYQLNEDEPVHRSSFGLSYERSIFDNDTITFAIEYFHNDEGYAHAEDYVGVLANAAYQPNYLGRDYAAFMIYLPTPGSLNDFNFILYNIGNLTDKSYITRLDMIFVAQQDLNCQLGAAYHWGEKTGEYRLGNQAVDVIGKVEISF